MPSVHLLSLSHTLTHHSIVIPHHICNLSNLPPLAFDRHTTRIIGLPRIKSNRSLYFYKKYPTYNIAMDDGVAWFRSEYVAIAAETHKTFTSSHAFSAQFYSRHQTTYSKKQFITIITQTKYRALLLLYFIHTTISFIHNNFQCHEEETKRKNQETISFPLFYCVLPQFRLRLLHLF